MKLWQRRLCERMNNGKGVVRRVHALCGALAVYWVAAVALASDVVFRDDFEAGLGRWQTSCPRLWRVADGAGEDGSKALVFETDGNTIDWPTVAFSVPCEPGRVYTLTYRVKVDSWKGTCCYSNLRWYGAGGAVLGFAEGRPHFDQRDVGRGWITVCTCTARTCTGTRLLRFSIAPGGCKSARFTVDDVELTADSPRIVESVHSSAYRDTAWGGEVTFVGEYVADAKAFPPDRLAPCFSFLGPDGKNQRVAGTVTNGTVRLSIPVERLAMGTHPVTLEFGLAGKPPADKTSLDFTRTASSPDWRVRFDSCRRAVVDGRPFFPIGMCMGADHILTHPGSLERYCEAGFNIVGFPSWDPNVKEEVLDRFASAGIRVLVNLDDKSPDVDRDVLLKEAGDLVERIKGHPGVFGWQVIDEAPPVWVDRKRDLQELVRRLDPDHPTSAVLDKPSHVRCFMSAFDIVSVDPYSIGNSCGPIGISTSWQRECDEQTWGLKPMWQFPQAFNWGWWRSGPRRPDYRFPWAIECRSQAWQAIAAGANGLIWYAYDTEKRCDRCEPGGFAEQWLHVKVAAQEVLAHQDVLLSDPGERVTSETPELSVRTWRHRGETWLLAVNTVTNAIRGTVAFGRNIPDDVRLALGAALPTKVGARKLAFEMKGLDVVLCRVPAKLDRSRFHIGACGLKPEFCDAAHLREIKDAGVDLVTCKATRPQLDLFAEAGLGCIVGGRLPHWFGSRGEKAGRMRTERPFAGYVASGDAFTDEDHPAAWMLDVCDEPNLRDIPYVAEVCSYVNRRFPATPAFVNVYPDYAMLAENTPSEVSAQLGTSDYRAYLEASAGDLGLDYLSFDFYPYFTGIPDAEARAWIARMLGNLRTAGEVCRSRRMDLWYFAQLNARPVKDGRPAALNRDQLRFQAFAAMAFGATMVNWACWSGWWELNVLDKKGNRTEQYDKVKDVNAEIRRVAAPFMRYRNVATREARTESGTPMLIGEMVSRTGGGARAYFIVPIGDPFGTSPQVRTVRMPVPRSAHVTVTRSSGGVAVKRGTVGEVSFSLAENTAALVEVE